MVAERSGFEVMIARLKDVFVRRVCDPSVAIRTSKIRQMGGRLAGSMYGRE